MMLLFRTRWQSFCARLRRCRRLTARHETLHGGLRCVHLPRDKGLHHLPRTIRLRPRLRDPLVLTTFEQLKLDITTGISIGLRESLLYRREDIVVESTLHDQEWHLCDRLVPVDDLLRIAFMDRLPGDEEGRIVSDHGTAFQLFRILVTGEGIADGRAHRDVRDRGIGSWPF